MKKYMACFGGIEETEIERETAKQVVFKNGRKVSKRSAWRNYYDTWEEAHDRLMTESKNKIDHTRKQLEIANEQFVNVKGMTKP